MYTLFIEALRRDRVGPGLNSAGNVALGCWQSTAKTLQSKTARMALWDVLFHTAMQEDCWEDVRFVSDSCSAF
jgi:N-terminal acetyltransferase B complex non-catalytic subunit